MEKISEERINKILTTLETKYENLDNIMESTYLQIVNNKYVNFYKHLNKYSKNYLYINLCILEKYYLNNEKYQKIEKIKNIKNSIYEKKKIKISEKLIMTLFINPN